MEGTRLAFASRPANAGRTHLEYDFYVQKTGTYGGQVCVTLLVNGAGSQTILEN